MGSARIREPKDGMRADIRAALAALTIERPVFHSEADFQHSLAWQLHAADPVAHIRLETRPRRGVRLDLLLTSDGARTAIELKYLVRRFNGVVGGESFDLPSQSAHDISRYDVIKDVVRTESFVAEGVADSGRVIVLTNDPAYWRPGRAAETIDAQLRLHEGRLLEGRLEWDPRAGSGTTKGREGSLALAGRYECIWHDYSIVIDSGGREHRWRYLDLNVNGVRGRTMQTSVSSVSEAPTLPGPVLSARAVVLAAARDLAASSPDGTFSPAEVVAKCRRRQSGFADATVRTHVVSVMCADAPEHHSRTFADFERAGRGRYRLRRDV